MGKRTEEVNQMKVPAPVSLPRMLTLEQVQETLNMPLPRMLTLEHVQETLNMGLPAVYSLVKSGELRAAQFGGRNVWRVREDDLAAFIEAAYEKTAQRIASGQIPEGDATGES